MNDAFFDITLFEIDKYSFAVKNLLFSLITIITIVILLLASKRFFRSSKIKNALEESNIKLIANFVSTLIILFGIYALSEAAGFNSNKYINLKIIGAEKVTIRVYHFFVIYIIIVGTKVFLSVIESIINAKEQSSQIERGKTKNIYQIIRYFIYLIAISVFIHSLGVNITILIASLSALLLGLGLGIQHLFNDVVSGVILLFDRSVKIGDVIEIKENVVGKVAAINLRTSTLITRDEIEVIIPNSKFTSDNIINWTHNKVQTRFYVNVGVAYGSDVRLVEKILIEVAKQHKEIAKYPEPRVRFLDFGDSSLDFSLRFYTNVTFGIGRIKSDLRFEIDKAFRENNITIPFPQRDVHFFPKT